MKLSDFDYTLPKEQIAQHAVVPKSYSRLLVVNGDQLYHRRFYQLGEFLQKGDVVVINQSKVLKNKLTGKKETGAAAEFIIMQAVDTFVAKGRLKCSRIRIGNRFYFDGLSATVVDRDEDIFYLKFDQPVKDIIDHYYYPNPPYIHRRVGDEYQTVYAEKGGSLAAPTAGLHFTPHLIRSLKKKGVTFTSITLHVGFGTFLPIRDNNIIDHKMEAEYYEISAKAAELINNAKRLFVVGTTTLKALESAARKNGNVTAKSEFSDLFIYPGFRFQLPVKGLITNFHLPKSSLILLVSAFYGWPRLKHAYEVAVKKGYRFFSLGDATLFLK
jgi:S-adenosylmethionine:tRNA ribosyltransferase-isomerase